MLRVKNTALINAADTTKPKRQAYSAKLLAVSITLTAGILSGCATDKTDDLTTASIGNDYRSRHPIVVSENEIIQDYIVSSSKRSLSHRDRNLTVEMARRFAKSGAKNLRIIRPVGSRNEHAGRRVSRGIAHELKKQGVSGGSIRHLTYNASGHGDAASVRVSFDALTAGVESECGQWNENLAANTANNNYHNFGCATQNNLATMISNPADLIGPRGQSPIDPTRRDNVIKKWQAGDSADN